MPRRNNRKHHKNEGSLGFNPDKYISRPGGGYSAPMKNTQRRISMNLIQKIEYENKPSHYRHKAHSYNRRKSRAMNEIKRMQQSAARVVPTAGVSYMPGILDNQKVQGKPVVLISYAPPNTRAPLNTHDPLTRPLSSAVIEQAIANESTTEVRPEESGYKTIFGGVIEWLKRKVHLA